MKIKGSNFKKAINSICSILVLASPILVSKSACYLFWGEPECPEALKQEIENR
ncbi:cyclic lactone autoinducer peptide [Clostridium sp. D2Q-14]|uniref:cyclic lactone autoinducer peptide n=1 Tax=Anaeromonas gelatinilytica TaxID=2683194 RepID=UPI00193B3AFF|nr:cyclic lactone autoinducer peptide [Anaeromonas gelatinilytica]MBS4535131.1 cyclic lactone autoinducer peptide [Anaeromonas gelatinilytica]